MLLRSNSRNAANGHVTSSPPWHSQDLSPTPQLPQTRVCGARSTAPSPYFRLMNPVNLGPAGREKPVPTGDFMVEGIELKLRLPEERFLGPGMADRHREVAVACV